MSDKVLVIAPHPDDEILGVGGTILKHINKNDEVFLCIVTKAYTPEWSEEFLETRKQELEKIRQFLNIKKIYNLDFPSLKLDTIPKREINEAISRVVSEVNPDILYIPHKGDLRADHRIVFESSLIAIRPINNRIKKVLSYETLSETEWGRPLGLFAPNIYVNIEDTIEKKKEAMKIYEGELQEYPHPRSLEGIEILAKKRGLEAGFKFAEAFMLIREID